MEKNTPKVQPYNHQEIEKKWQEIWEKNALFSPDMEKAKRPFYNLMMFPYPSAEGMHVGNFFTFTGIDTYGRYKRMQGYDVFEPIGLDGFGIHSENYALKVNRHPKEQAKISERNFYRQLRATGNAFDWKRTLETYDPDYYKWTQWLFVQMFKSGLAYKAKAPVNWCPSCKTVLADEQVVKKKIEAGNLKIEARNEGGGSKLGRSSFKHQASSQPSTFNLQPSDKEINVCERCGTEVTTKNLSQWFFRIASGVRPNSVRYPDALLNNLNNIDWVEKVKVGQRNWIGRKEGINIKYKVKSKKKEIYIECFTTRPDTNFGATFIVIGPEHWLVEKIIRGEIISIAAETDFSAKPQNDKKKINAIKDYVAQTKKKTKEERTVEGAKKTGVFTGLYAINDLNGKELPVYISDFVLGEVGTGAVIGVPGHDKRDFQFAKTFNLPIIRVVVGSDTDVSQITREEQVQEEAGTMINSDFLNGLDIHEATKKMMAYLEEKGWGKRVVHYHLRDWLISRQRYWGTPIPMVYCKRCADKGVSWFNSSEEALQEGKWDVGSGTWEVGRGNIEVGNKKNLKGGKTKSNPTSNHQNISLPNQASHFQHLTSMVGWFPVPEEDLPVLLPDVKDWRPTGTGRGPLVGVPEFVKTTCPNCGGEADRETDVCDTFLDSSWYFLRYPSINDGSCRSPAPRFTHSLTSGGPFVGRPGSRHPSIPWNPEITKKWLPVDSYIGGAEHTVLHLLYARWIWMVLYDLGYFNPSTSSGQVSFRKLNSPQLAAKECPELALGFIPLIFSAKGQPSSGWDEPFPFFYANGLIIKEGAKMSKSKGNVINPDDYITAYGADSLRMYLRFIGPFDRGGDFSDSGMEGMYRFVNRVWRLVIEWMLEVGNWKLDREVRSEKLERVMHKSIKEVTEDMDKLRFNTALAHIMVYVNEISTVIQSGSKINSQVIKTLLLLLAPFMPFMTEELWQRIRNGTWEVGRGNIEVGNKKNLKGGKTKSNPTSNHQNISLPNQASHFSLLTSNFSPQDSIHFQPWPRFDPALLQKDTLEIVVQVNGKFRDTIEVKSHPFDKLRTRKLKVKSEIEEIAKQSEKVRKYLEGKVIKKTIFVPGRLINFVV